MSRRCELRRAAGRKAAGARRRPLARERFERIYRTLRDRICLLEYPPGTRLSEEELAEEFAISRTPVRRVLARLEAEGLVEARHGVGTIVTDVELEALAQVYQLRLELAVLIGRLSPLSRAAARSGAHPRPDPPLRRAVRATPTTRRSRGSTWISSPRSRR